METYARTFMIMSRSVLPRIKNILVKICSENQNTHFMSNIFFKYRAVYKIM
jgi:hypothetical protein